MNEKGNENRIVHGYFRGHHCDLNDDLITKGNKLRKTISMNKLHQLDKLTRITSRSATLLDVIVTNKRDTVLHADVLPNVPADHDFFYRNGWQNVRQH